jgi:glycosyltransferase involved in cell wall biosynthesis
VARDNGGCGFYRCRQPAEFIKRMGLAEVEVFQNVAPEDKILAADLVIMQEMGSVNAGNLMHFMVDNKIPYVAEFDDFIQHVSPHNLAGYGAWNPGTLFVNRAMALARGAMGMTVSTPQLAREYFPYNQTIYVVPNYLDKDRWDVPVVKRNDDKIRIGWAGGNAHADDLKMIAKVLDKIVKEFKGKVIFETMGMTKNELAGVFPMTDFTNVCPSCGYEGELHHYPGELLDQYPLVLASKGWDIAVAPVINNSFNNCKSDIKIKEYSAMCMPVVASPITPYVEAKQTGADIRFANNFEEWYNVLKELIKNPKERGEMVKKNKEWVANYWIQDNTQKIFEVYLQTIAKAELILGKKK